MHVPWSATMARLLILTALCVSVYSLKLGHPIKGLPPWTPLGQPVNVPPTCRPPGQRVDVHPPWVDLDFDAPYVKDVADYMANMFGGENRGLLYAAGAYVYPYEMPHRYEMYLIELKVENNWLGFDKIYHCRAVVHVGFAISARFTFAGGEWKGPTKCWQM